MPGVWKQNKISILLFLEHSLQRHSVMKYAENRGDYFNPSFLGTLTATPLKKNHAMRNMRTISILLFLEHSLQRGLCYACTRNTLRISILLFLEHSLQQVIAMEDMVRYVVFQSFFSWNTHCNAGDVGMGARGSEDFNPSFLGTLTATNTILSCTGDPQRYFNPSFLGTLTAT